MGCKKFFRSQKAYLAQLSKSERALLYSFFLFGLASPIFFVYTNTFLWRESLNIATVIIYNIGIYLGVSFGFFANTIGLRFFPARRLYLFACVLQGIVPVVLVALVPSAHQIIFALGAVSGLSAGMYYANRNYFTSLMTRSAHRFSFLTLEQGLSTIASIVAPAAVGWFIAFGEHAQLYNVSVAYQFSVVLGLLLLIFSGLAVSNIKTSNARQRTTRVFLTQASARWNGLRRMDFFNGVMNGVDMTVPLLATVTLVGMEDAVGTLQTVSAIAATCAVYIVGKRYSATPQSYTLRVWLIIISLAGLAVTMHFTPWTIVFYTIVAGLMGPFRGAAIASILYKTVDHEAGDDRALYLFDRELFLNIGRIISLVLLAYCGAQWPTETLRFGFSAVILFRAFFVFSATTVDAANTRS